MFGQPERVLRVGCRGLPLLVVGGETPARAKGQLRLKAQPENRRSAFLQSDNSRQSRFQAAFGLGWRGVRLAVVAMIEVA